jgi:hypothetical protein
MSIPAYSDSQKISQDIPQGLCFAARCKKLEEKPSEIQFNSPQKEAIYISSHAHQRYQVYNINIRLPCECSIK